MLLKKLFFLAIPVIVVYWRSRTAQNAARWLFRGVIPEDGPLGKVMTEINRSEPYAGSAANSKMNRPRPLLARVADNWSVVFAFLAGLCLAAILFSGISSRS